jgi:hypothetical protein
MGFGNGPVIAVGVTVGAAALFAGWGLAQFATSDGGFIQALQGNHTRSKHQGTPVRRTPEAAAPSSRARATRRSNESGACQNPAPGRDDEDKRNGSGAPAGAKPASKRQPYTVKPGDTHIVTSGTTGAPIGISVETNKIQNPDFIYAWALLLIPPV